MKIPVYATLVAACLLSAEAEAFCGFYVSGGGTELFNNATQVVLVREGTRTVLSMQNNYQGPPSDFAMVIPVPIVLQKENVKTLPRDVFERIDKLDAPRLVEYWEQDPCRPPPPPDERVYESAMPSGIAVQKAGGGRDYGVKIEAQFTVGEYEIVILSAKDALGLDAWLKDNKYKIPDGAEPILRPYVQQGMKFFVAKVNAKKVTFKDGMAALSPLRFHYDTEKFELPIRLGLINAKDKQDLIVHILAANQRYEVANYPNVTIPTNIDLVESAKNEFAAFYVSLFDMTLEKNKRAVVTEYAWQATSCDPCPVSPLSEADMATFGGDVLGTAKGKDKGKETATMNPTSTWVLTRLHARYDKTSLGEDLVFKAAPPIVGGREFMQGAEGLERGSRPDSMNNFQGRYAIRHAWKGKIACNNPVRGIWGGDPNGGSGTTVARDTAFAPRKKDLASTAAESAVAELGIKGVKERAGIPVNQPAPKPAPKKGTP